MKTHAHESTDQFGMKPLGREGGEEGWVKVQ